MLTLKVITHDPNGHKETHLFYGERIQHKERDAKERLKFDLTANEIVISTMMDVSSREQEYTYSTVFLYGDEDTPKQLIWIMPCADCYIMHEGKTVDSFSVRFK